MNKVELEAELKREKAKLSALRAERDRLLSENADLQLATAGITMGADGTCVVLSVPVATLNPDQYVTRHVDVTLDAEAAESLARVTQALDRKNATLKSGRRCIKVPDTIRWLCEQLAEKVER